MLKFVGSYFNRFVTIFAQKILVQKLEGEKKLPKSVSLFSGKMTLCLDFTYVSLN